MIHTAAATHLSVLQAVFLGILQGVSELFPISSLGHIIIVKHLLHWHFNTGNKNFLSFVVALHLATAAALLIYFWGQWKKVIFAYLGSIRHGKLVYDQDSKFAWLLVAGTIVVGLVGLTFEKKFRLFFDDPRYYWMVCVFLILNGGVMFLGDYMKKLAMKKAAERQQKHAEDLTFPQGAAVGAAQTLALFPGISRSGVAIVGGVLAGLTYEEACRFAFMLATPVIAAAGLLKVPALFKPEAHAILYLTVPAAITAGITAYLSTKFLMKYFETRRLTPFAIYCVVLGTVALLLAR
ncbi:MAG: undecaprenyl-diphosphate phosphatase [Planctomycetia bacterium]|nr:undecaprenyl-diphosphate phosphatase [Planctomycetia bacterium]